MNSPNGENTQPQPPVINISITGSGARLDLVAPVAYADAGSHAAAAVLGSDASRRAGQSRPLWYRTSVVWAAVSAFAALAGVLVAWSNAR
ncbi:hypothetical protein [Kitasatospora sp. NPDC088346]|uniref:hypothetical protein n=1 Tax=Kitasatospora sp. NPDC088346 TaxID=3364073 RepID=UPI00383052B8